MRRAESEAGEYSNQLSLAIEKRNYNDLAQKYADNKVQGMKGKLRFKKDFNSSLIDYKKSLILNEKRLDLEAQFAPVTFGLSEEDIKLGKTETQAKQEFIDSELKKYEDTLINEDILKQVSDGDRFNAEQEYITK
jgi:hypothetical protein